MKHGAAIAVLAVLISSTVVHAAAPKREAGDTLEARRATKALNIRESRGFAAGVEEKSRNAFADFRAHGKDFVATIVQHGRTFVLLVDPDTNQVTRQD